MMLQLVCVCILQWSEANMQWVDAEEVAGKLDDLSALRSLKLQRTTKPFEMRFHMKEEIKAWTPLHVSHFLRVMGLASLITTIQADGGMDGPAFACWLLQLHATVKQSSVADESCTSPAAAHQTAFASLQSGNGWGKVHAVMMRTHLGLLMQAMKRPLIDCSRRFQYTSSTAVRATDDVVEALRHCGVVIVSGLLPDDAALLSKLQSLPSDWAKNANNNNNQSCSDAESAESAKNMPAVDGSEDTKEALGQLRGGRKEVFLPLTEATAWLVPSMMHHAPITTILTKYLEELQGVYQQAGAKGGGAGGSSDEDDLIMGAASLDLAGEYDAGIMTL
jgi:hypothetical protein